MVTKKDIFKRYLNEYLKANKKRKTEILNNVCDVIKMDRKSAVRRFRVLQMKDSSIPEKRGRKEYYTTDVTSALKEIWEAGSKVCGELLHPMIQEYVEILQRDKMWVYEKETTDKLTDKLLEMSEATTKRKVGKFMKARRKGKGKSTTKPSNLKNIIQVFHGSWEDKPVGYGQLDTVVHCGHSLLGDMAWTVNFVDIQTRWTVPVAQWNKGQIATIESIEKIKEKLPFKMIGLHPDNGSEFINWNLKSWCEENKIDLTRSRAGKKNDNPHIEQKNGHVVRRFLGYSRIDHRELIFVMNEIYDLLNIYLNHFVATKKCIDKVKVGSKYRRKYDKAKTPYQRVLAHQDVTQDVRDNLTKEHEKHNPLILKREIDKLIIKLFKLQKSYNDREF